MQGEWSVECSSDDPVLVVPWNDPDDPSGAAFVDLRDDPSALDWLPEAEQYPPIMQALRALNASRSPFFTAKCDVWSMAEDEVERLQIELGLDVPFAEEAHRDPPPSFGIASYIDIVCRRPSHFAAFARQEMLMQRLVRFAAPSDHPAASLELVLRPAFLQLEMSGQGYAISLYVKALGASSSEARSRWSAALDAVVALLRRPGLLL